MHGAISSRSVSTPQAWSIGTGTVNSLSSFMKADLARSDMRLSRTSFGSDGGGSRPAGVVTHPPHRPASENDQPGEHVGDPRPVHPTAQQRRMHALGEPVRLP